MYLEARWGTAVYMLLYFAGGIGAVLMSCCISPNTVGVGASGAIMAIMGAYLVEILTVGAPDEPVRKFELTQVALFIAMTLLLGFAPFVDFSAHLGGVLVGALLGLGLFTRAKNSRLAPYPKVKWAVLAAGFGLAALFFVIQIPLFFTVVDPHELN
eukprot:TRINITY_DN555_c1_g2_i1.p4 TRINITY_DN555_c1_g2~~TRINITY_DN555_c1_g2_i1.p4  ORF type:complete len:156 (+),score=54.65 TRINITY_DN555_c1_g2_i1:643-1110(+)